MFWWCCQRPHRKSIRAGGNRRWPIDSFSQSATDSRAAWRPVEGVFLSNRSLILPAIPLGSPQLWVLGTAVLGLAVFRHQLIQQSLDPVDGLPDGRGDLLRRQGFVSNVDDRLQDGLKLRVFTAGMLVRMCDSHEQLRLERDLLAEEVERLHENLGTCRKMLEDCLVSA